MEDKKMCSSCCRLKSYIHFKYLKTKDEYSKTCAYCREKSRKCVIRQKEAGTWVQPNKYITKKQQKEADEEKKTIDNYKE